MNDETDMGEQLRDAKLNAAARRRARDGGMNDREKALTDAINQARGGGCA